MRNLELSQVGLELAELLTNRYKFACFTNVLRSLEEHASNEYTYIYIYIYI